MLVAIESNQANPRKGQQESSNQLILNKIFVLLCQYKKNACVSISAPHICTNGDSPPKLLQDRE